ncbi:uncharacterized protein LOC117542824 isoform X5 [Gymnodraco acuticeps]|uniref:Uncharacterized protein LOC117542824 isoform X5 n=1 Tax=Gymnodraco acuticeps TaxID=8218 RepID=A0A6P8U654_GYMAC|nr:uncharacterized protein LOC117542824 isoform X5 [Gymnodraco acuticeps]XP_034066575.1 uncharacterized protein LOC117542824 isoform X5 [Gymnodraco acuticeps]
MGASPDGSVTCTCHGTGICEIKCPHSKQEEANLRLCAGEQGFCLVNDGGTVKLDRRHAYYHQVQAQLHVVDVDYCDFVVWTKNDLFVERIVRDVDLWDNIIPRVESFFRLCVLSEVLGQQLTRGKPPLPVPFFSFSCKMIRRERRRDYQHLWSVLVPEVVVLSLLHYYLHSGSSLTCITAPSYLLTTLTRGSRAV